MFLEFFEQEVLLFVALGVIVAMLVYSYIGDKISGITTVNADEAVRLYNQDAYVLDVRTPAEYSGGFIGEAVNISSTDIRDKLSALEAYKEKPILVYCQSGARSSSVARLLAKQGFTKVYNLAGGILTWKNAGLPINTAKTLRKQKHKNKSK